MTTAEFDVLIIGAGPAGCTCALALKDAGLKVALLDKQTFPRDKVCGDAIPGRALKTLGSINHAYANALKAFPKKCDTRTSTLIYKGETLTFDWVLDAFTCTRMDFDNFLFALVKEHTETQLLTGISPDIINVSRQSVSVTLRNKSTILKARMVIGADGAHSIVAKQLTNRKPDRKHHVGSVRAYYANVADMKSSNIEVYFDKKFLPSYLWVFPLPDNISNVGFGMLSSEIARRKLNIKTVFYDFINHTPELKRKFADAERIGALEGYGLPLGSKIGNISGANFMLAGDAASLIDPISGDGIGNAMLSGKLAAEQVIRCFEHNDFSASRMLQYDIAIDKALGKELKTRFRAQRILFAMPFLLDLIFMAGKNKALKKIIQKGL
jgi:menaquinone-9 beta-reductase